MIRAKNIDNEIKTTIDLVTVISRVRQAIGGLARAFDINTILLLVKGGCFKPCGTLLFVDQILIPQFAQ